MNLNECIRFTSETVEGLKTFSGHNKEWYMEAIEKIKQRAENPYLNVALIGDFSSGKSTFINGLIKQDILKTAWLATTAVPTHMYYQERDQISIILEMADDKRFYFDTKEDRIKFEKRIGKTLPEDIKDLVAFLSTSNDFAQQIRRIKLYTPVDEIMKKICIIDTPGVNPGAQGTESHVMATRTVLHEYADATIVLFKSDQVYTNSFSRFLEENAKHLMEDAVFVVTMMDILEEEEQQEVIGFVKERLKQTFQLENPIVYGCSAKYANYCGDDTKAKQWSNEFDVLRHEMIQYIEDNRVRIIQKQLNSLLKQLITELDKEITYNINFIQSQIEVLEKHAIDKLKSELHSNFIIYKRRVNEQYLNIKPSMEYEKMFQNIRLKAEIGIESCTKLEGTGRETISGYMKEGFPEVVRIEQENLSRRINTAFDPINKLQKDYVEENKTLFYRYNLALNQKRMSDIQSQGGISYSQEFSVGHIDGAGTIQDLVHAAGLIAAIPVMIPLAFLDGFLGTGIADVWENAVFGVINFIGALGVLRRNKDRAIAEMKAKMDLAERENKQKFISQIQDRKNNVISAMEKMNEIFVSEYQKVYNAKSGEFKEEQKRLNDEMEWNRNTQERLKQYLTELERKGSIGYEFI